MTITAEQKYLLNNKMGRVASHVQLGTLIENAESVVAGEIALAEGKLLVGNGSGVAAATTLTSGQILVGNGSSVATAVAVSGDVTLAATGEVAIAAGAIVNADVNASAAIAYSKLNLATSILNADINASAAIAFSKLAALPSAQILVGNGSNVAAAVAMSGDITITNGGVTAIGANKVLASMINEEVEVVSSTVSLTQTNILNLNATPITLVSAPAAGKAIVPLMIEFFHDYATAAYTNAGGGHVVIEYDDGTDVVVLNASRVTDTADANVVLIPSAFDVAGSGTGAGLAPVAASALRITKATAEFADGNAANIVKIRVWYRVVTLLT